MHVKFSLSQILIVESSEETAKISFRILPNLLKSEVNSK
jgi:hypothetical protein